MYHYLYQDPIIFVLWIATVLVALSVHEFSHALGAYLMGDKTSQYMGRLTLNPLAHIDVMGLLMLVFIGFGWGKPVPFNPYNLRNNRWGQAMVAIFGPLSNIVMAGICIAALKALIEFSSLEPSNLLIQFLLLLVFINLMLAIFNFIPIPPLDGSKVLFSLLPPRFDTLISFLETRGPIILIMILLIDSLLGVSLFGGLFSRAYELVFWILG